MEFDLVFEGGGAKGLLFVGALEACEAQGVTPGRLLGTSAGAITATFLAAGYTTQDVYKAVDEKTEDGRAVFETFLGEPEAFDAEALAHSQLRRFLDSINVPLVPDFAERKVGDQLLQLMANDARFSHVLNFMERGGWFSADHFVTWLRKYLDQGEDQGAPRHYSDMSFNQLYEATGRELTLIAADTSAARMLALNRRTAPDCPVVWAARMSMSVPLLWEEVIWQSEWGLYRGRDISGHSIVDGGLLSNFPIELFISDAPQVTAVMGEKKAANVAGFLIDESLPVPGAPDKPVQSSSLDLGAYETVRRLNNLVNTATQAHDRAVIEAFEHLVVRLPARGYGTTEFDMSDERKQALITAGRETTERYLRQRLAVHFEPPTQVEPPTPAQVADERALKILEE